MLNFYHAFFFERHGIHQLSLTQNRINVIKPQTAAKMCRYHVRHIIKIAFVLQCNQRMN